MVVKLGLARIHAIQEVFNVDGLWWDESAVGRAIFPDRCLSSREDHLRAVAPLALVLEIESRDALGAAVPRIKPGAAGHSARDVGAGSGENLEHLLAFGGTEGGDRFLAFEPFSLFGWALSLDLIAPLGAHGVAHIDGQGVSHKLSKSTSDAKSAHIRSFRASNRAGALGRQTENSPPPAPLPVSHWLRAVILQPARKNLPLQSSNLFFTFSC
jgi:hypothetical protein